MSYLQKGFQHNQNLHNNSNKIPLNKLRYTKGASRQDDLDNSLQSILSKLDECIGNGDNSRKQTYASHELRPGPLLEELKLDLNGNNREIASLESKVLSSSRTSDPAQEDCHAKVIVMIYSHLLEFCASFKPN